MHRDIKPENVLIQDGHALVADFGIARAVSEAGGERASLILARETANDVLGRAVLFFFRGSVGVEPRIAKLELNAEARKEIDRELSRLERTNPQSAEYQVIRTYLDYVIELPWNERTDDKIVLAESEKILEEDHYGLEDVKDRVLEFLAVRKLQMELAEEDALAGWRVVVELVPVDEAEGDLDGPSADDLSGGTGAAVRGDPVAELGVAANELPARALGVVPLIDPFAVY